MAKWMLLWKLALILSTMFADTSIGFQIGFISNITFIPRESNGTTVVVSQSCTLCSCLAKQNNYSGFNCFSTNESCSMFRTYSTKYDLNRTSYATFYFFQLPPSGKNDRSKVRYTVFLSVPL